jgi:Ni2+-binding GTPase involved in maturation of urease and hydrogenase
MNLGRVCQRFLLFAAVTTKMELAEAVEFDHAAVNANILAVRPGMTIQEVAAKPGRGLDSLVGVPGRAPRK